MSSLTAERDVGRVIISLRCKELRNSHLGYDIAGIREYEAKRTMSHSI